VANISGKLLSALANKFGLLAALRKQQQKEGGASSDGAEPLCYNMYTGDTHAIKSQASVAKKNKSKQQGDKKGGGKKKKVKETLFGLELVEDDQRPEEEVRVATSLLPFLEAFRRDYAKCFDVLGKFDFEELFATASASNSKATDDLSATSDSKPQPVNLG
jgi:hypothetical protein